MKSAKWENIFKGWNSSESEAVHTLKKIPVFKNLSRNDFSELENMMHHRDYKIGDFIFKNRKISSLIITIKENNLNDKQIEFIENSINKKKRKL